MKIHESYDLSQALWYKIGGKARYLLECENQEDIKEAIAFIQKNSIQKLFIIGLGSNLIFDSKDFDGAVIRIVSDGKGTIQLTPEGNIEAFSGETLDRVIQFSFENNLVGLEWAGGLPGTVGAAVRGNVGAFGGEIKDVLIKATVLRVQENGAELITMNRDELQFSYRDSAIKQNRNLVVVSAIFSLRKAAPEELENARKVYEQNIAYRKEKHPLNYPNCGSVFKNISKQEQVEKVLSVWPDARVKVQNDWHGKVSMGYIIHRLGLTGMSKGQAQVSEKHSNFIINRGGATSSDVLEIITTIQEKVNERFGFIPEVEVEIVSSE